MDNALRDTLIEELPLKIYEKDKTEMERLEDEYDPEIPNLAEAVAELRVEEELQRKMDKNLAHLYEDENGEPLTEATGKEETSDDEDDITWT